MKKNYIIYAEWKKKSVNKIQSNQFRITMFVARILISLSPYGLKSLEMINTEVIYKKIII